jgi:hypothetical protein
VGVTDGVNEDVADTDGVGDAVGEGEGVARQANSQMQELHTLGHQPSANALMCERMRTGIAGACLIVDRERSRRYPGPATAQHAWAVAQTDRE